MVRRKPDKSRRNQDRYVVNKINRPRTEVLVNKKRVKSGIRALQEIKYLRKTTKLLIPKRPFYRLVKEIIYDLFPRSDVSRMQALAIEALQEAAETYIVQYFEDATLLSHHNKRQTLMRPDMILLRRLRGRDDVINR